MAGHIAVSLHFTPDMRCIAERGGGYVWLRLGPNVTVFITDENDLAELAGVIDQAGKLLADI